MNFSDIRKTMREKVGGALGVDLSSDEKASSESEVDGSSNDSDTSAIKILEAIRSVYIKNHIVGSVEVALTITSISYTISKQTAISCDIGSNEVDNETEEAAEETAEQEKLSKLEQAAITAALASIKGLKLRAKKYMRKSYISSSTLSESLTISMPVLRLFDINVSISATVQSLLDSEALE